MVGQWTVSLFGTLMVVNTIESLRDTEPATHPTPASLCLLAAELLTVQFLHNRAETASDRTHETNGEFARAREAELAGLSPRGVEASRVDIDARLDAIRAEDARQALEPSEAQRKSLETILAQARPEPPEEPTPPDAHIAQPPQKEPEE
jgi:hypothetical protein